MEGSVDPVSLIYDGECPFCSRFARYTRLKKTLSTMRLINAREGGPEVDQAVARGLVLDEGMVLVIGSAYYHGDACLNRLALMSSESDPINRLNAFLFRSPTISRLAYPILRSGRNLVLRLLGRSKMGL